MRLETSLFAIASCVALGCQGFSQGAPSVSPASGPTKLAGELVFYVHGWMGEGPRMLPEVSVWMVTHQGQFRDLGKTDVFGGIAIKKQEVLNGVVLGFSREGFFDGVWRVDPDELSRFDELHIGLAPFSVF